MEYQENEYGVEFSSLKAISQFSEIKFGVQIFLLVFDSQV